MIIYKELETIEEITNCLNDGGVIFQCEGDFYDDGYEHGYYQCVTLYKLKGENIFTLFINLDVKNGVMFRPIEYSNKDDILNYINKNIEYSHFFIMEGVIHLFNYLDLNYNAEYLTLCKDKINEFVGAKHD